MAKKDLPSAEVLRQLLRYDPETGKLFWRNRPSSLVASGRGRTSQAAANTWNAAYAGKEALCCLCNYGYLRGAVLNKTVRAHIVVWAMAHGAWPTGDIDHIDGNRQNNRVENLREASRSQNNGNQRLRLGGTSRYKGVCWHGKKWTAGIALDGRRKHLGLFANEEDAARAYDRAAVEQWGQFARTNFAMSD